VLNALSGKAPYGVLHGMIRYNGQVMAPVQVKKLVGYVPQDDIVHEDLTVEENINMSRLLRGGFREAREGQLITHEVPRSLWT
jgi:ABC-type multidrug transport system ATPase subunit